jgi:uncharacterized surface protein with fasciclin (FAS1) repeats
MKSLVMAFTLFLSSHLALASARLETDIVDTAVAAGSFKTLVAAVTAADLVPALKDHGPLTVFAPLDRAFDNLPQGSLDFLLANKPILSKVLTYHVSRGEPYLYDLAGLNLLTLQGQNVKISRVGNSYFVNEARILNIIQVKNGQIVVIDRVLRPF